MESMNAALAGQATTVVVGFVMVVDNPPGTVCALSRADVSRSPYKRATRKADPDANVRESLNKVERLRRSESYEAYESEDGLYRDGHSVHRV